MNSQQIKKGRDGMKIRYRIVAGRLAAGTTTKASKNGNENMK